MILLGCMGSAFSPTGCRKNTTPPDVILVTFDTTIAKRLGHLGHTRPTSPHLDRLANQGISFHRAYSTSTWTAPAHASILTGLYPSEHGCHSIVGIGDRPRPFHDHIPTLGEQFQRRGYHTAAFIGGPYLSSSFGFARGFDHYDDELQGTERIAKEVNRLAFEWLANREDSQRVFLFLNYFDPHGPYTPSPDLEYPFGPSPEESELRQDWMFSPGDFKRREEEMPDESQIQDLLLRYDQEIYATDFALGQLIDTLKRSKRWENSILIVTGDHGESFGWKNGEVPVWGHGLPPFENQCHVPLVIRRPNNPDAGISCKVPVSVADIYPTLMACLNPEAEFGDAERNLISLAAGNQRDSGLAMAERYFAKRYTTALWKGEFKLLRDLDLEEMKTGATLVSLPEPPAAIQRLNISLLDPESHLPRETREQANTVVNDLSASWSQYLKTRGLEPELSPGEAAEGPLNDELKAMLKKMGYLED